MRVLRAVWLAMALLVSMAPAAEGQAVEESRLLREAAARESRGDFDGAERVLRRLLETNPSSSGGLFALERVLRAKGDPEALLPVVDTFLAHDASASGVRQLKLRVLLEVDSLRGVEVEAERWFRAQPASEASYREVARIYERAFGPDRALEILRRGRAATGSRSALALEMGDVLAATGKITPALEEWALAVGDEGAQAAAVGRRVAGLPGDARGAAATLVGILGRAQEFGRNRAGVQIALEMRLGDEALALAKRTVPGLDERARTAFLSDVARRARDAGVGEVAAWAYAELGEDAESPAERRQFDQRLVEMSLADGDTAAALEAQRRVVASFTPGSVDRRRATALEIRLQGALSPPEELMSWLEAFRGEFPDAPELDELAAQIAGTLLARGDPAAAEAVLEGMAGPRSSLQRGYLLLGRGSAAEARQAFLLALTGLEPSEATSVIQFVSLLGRLSPASGGVLGDAEALAHLGRGGEAAGLVASGLEGLPEEERPALLAEAARMADAGGVPDQGAALRSRLLSDHPDSPEAAEASLSLARWRAATPGGREEAIRLLEDLVTRAPGAAVVPDARRELERLRRGS
ncbi:MAG: hypothetical protein Q8N53_19470 [Longimicrobiales bacterium]|nr:hypothetical protein [Longimicrobiales bacterium]